MIVLAMERKNKNIVEFIQNEFCKEYVNELISLNAKYVNECYTFMFNENAR